MIPILDGIVEEGHSCVGFNARVRGLAKDDALPGMGGSGFKGLEGHFTNRDEVGATRGADKVFGVGLGFDYSFEDGVPDLCSTVKEGLQIEGVWTKGGRGSRGDRGRGGRRGSRLHLFIFILFIIETVLVVQNAVDEVRFESRRGETELSANSSKVNNLQL